MSWLVITAAPLLGRWSITSAVRRDEATWPPSADTLFSALVAAAASLGNACHPALYWLESLGNPAIDAPPNAQVTMTESVVHYQPVADRTPWEKGARQARWHNSVAHPGAVSWSWKIDTPEHLEAVRRIAQEITYIGSSRGPVVATAWLREEPPGPGVLVPAGSGQHRIRGIYAGRLDELEAIFQQGERPKPTQPVAYARLGEEALTSIWGQMIPLRRVVGQRLHVTQSVPITEAVRRALTRHLPDGAPGALTGHAADGAALPARHMAIVPLPHVGDPHADGDVLGVGLLLPADLDDGDYQLLIRGLGSWLAAGGEVGIGRNRWQLEVAHQDPRKTLYHDRLSGSCHTWASITPVVCDRHPRRDLTLRQIVTAMCRDVGLPDPEAIDAAPHGTWTGSADSRRHSLGTRDYLGRHFTTHLRISWAREIPGPVLLGRGRYFGLGAMLPMREAV